jgi:hypothetical protein
MSQRLRVAGVLTHEFRVTNPELQRGDHRTGRGDPRRPTAVDGTLSGPNIDAAVALMMAGRAMAEDQEQVGLNAFLSNPIAF